MTVSATIPLNPSDSIRSGKEHYERASFAVFPIITEALKCVHRLAALIGLTNAKTHVQQVALGPFSWPDVLLHCLISTTGAKGNKPGHVHYSCNLFMQLSQCFYCIQLTISENVYDLVKFCFWIGRALT